MQMQVTAREVGVTAIKREATSQGWPPNKNTKGDGCCQQLNMRDNNVTFTSHKWENKKQLSSKHQRQEIFRDEESTAKQPKRVYADKSWHPSNATLFFNPTSF